MLVLKEIYHTIDVFHSSSQVTNYHAIYNNNYHYYHIHQNTKAVHFSLYNTQLLEKKQSGIKIIEIGKNDVMLEDEYHLIIYCWFEQYRMHCKQ